MCSTNSIFTFILLFLCCCSSGFCQQPVRVTRNVEVTAAEEKVRDKAGYEAIRDIHREMDDDHSGSIDRNESTGFMKEDMHMRGTERTRRENKFHGEDDSITVDDLWEAWFESNERTWTNERLVEWLSTDLNLPIVADIARQKKLDGKVLPRFSTQNPDYLTKELGIKSSVHRQKLRLNSLDVVLFGYRDNNNKTKDILLALLALLLTSLIIVYIRQKQRAQKKVHELFTKLTELKNMESEFETVQKKLNDEKNKRSVSDCNVNQVEMQNLRLQLEEAERRLEANSIGIHETPLALQPLLRRTCENEMAFLEKQRQECFKEMKDAIEMVDRLQKKQGSVLSSLKLATGAASTSDQVDSKIFALKSRMEKIHGLTRETQERWMQIESLCGFSILYTNETEHINRVITSSSKLFNQPSSNHSGGGSTSSESASQSRPKISSVSNNKIQKLNEKQSSSHDLEEVEHHEEFASIQFQQKMPISKSLDNQSTVSTVDSSKKRRSILPKFFRKTTSKGSLNNNSISSN
ncbi:unnamed protein product [Caenorhabditis angaria]|uniref:SAM domain-containing protein n=1 Tax=Caenorhabditis angaria TaxID=860376 RepID=A0A9P1IK85_9PELO|nr:unnamed protein product [Caenorhabditis angaria]